MCEGKECIAPCLSASCLSQSNRLLYVCFVGNLSYSKYVRLKSAFLQSLVRPDDEEAEKTRKETQAALDRIVGVKISAAQPTSLAPQPDAPTYIKYTPAQKGSQYNSGAEHRIIKMQDMPVDPLEPPKFRAKKVCKQLHWLILAF